MLKTRGVVGFVALLMLSAVAPAISAPAIPGSKARIETALRNLTTARRPGQDTLATIFDGNKYVQCRRASKSLLCEAAGALMQSSLERVLIPERIERLTAMGWRLEPSFGNYVQTFPPELPLHDIVNKIIETLAEGYDANINELDVRNDWVKSERCPPRNGPSQSLAGMINNATQMAATAVHACAYTPIRSASDVVNAYGKQIEAEVKRLRTNAKRNVFFVIQAGIGYVQCAPASGAIYCEAQSADSWSMLAHVLTSERVERLHAAGFSDPGRSPNYWRVYSFPEFDEAAIARELLTILYDVYGYEGPAKLKVLSQR